MVVALAVVLLRPASAQSPELQKILAEIKARDSGQLAVSEEDGRFLRLLVASKGARHALEIGGASGYSAIWIGMGLRETGGKLVTIEYDPVRAKELAENIRRAGLTDVVQVTDSAGSSIPTCVSAGINPCSQRSLESRLTNSGNTV